MRTVNGGKSKGKSEWSVVYGAKRAITLVWGDESGFYMEEMGLWVEHVKVAFGTWPRPRWRWKACLKEMPWSWLRLSDFRSLGETYTP